MPFNMANIIIIAIFLKIGLVNGVYGVSTPIREKKIVGNESLKGFPFEGLVPLIGKTEPIDIIPLESEESMYTEAAAGELSETGTYILVREGNVYLSHIRATILLHPL
jgi:hypothetical protein